MTPVTQTSKYDDTFQLLENVIFLKKNNLFSSMNTSEIRALASIAQIMTFHEGNSIVRENDVGDSLFIIKEGRVKIIKNAEEINAIELAVLSQGECFGEMALFDAELRSATVIAVEPCVLLCIHDEDLHDVLMDYPSIAIQFIKTFVKRLRHANSTIASLSDKK